ncbi:MAG: helix-turn-helix transcriptional regulator [Sporolactobacillus sp.]
MKNTIGKRIEGLREKKGWTKTYTAKKLGIKTMSTYANWEYGLRIPDSEMLSKIADLFDVSIDYIAGRTDNMYYYDLTTKDVTTPEKIVTLREKKGWSQREFAKRVGLDPSVMNRIEVGKRPIKDDELTKIADVLDVSIDYIIGRTDKMHYYDLTEKDEKDVARQLENLLEGMNSRANLNFDGEPMDETTQELVKAQIEANLRFAKQMAKKKFTPKKYRDNSED